MAYIALFRLNEIPIHEFKDMILEQDLSSMNMFFTYIFDISYLRETIKPLWMEYFDESFIENKILSKLESNLPLFKGLLNHLSLKATGKKNELIDNAEEESNPNEQSVHGHGCKQNTVFQPFNLSEKR